MLALFRAPSRRLRCRRGRLLPLAAVAILAACEGETSATGPDGNPANAAINQVVTVGPLNASSTDTLVYLSLLTGTLVPKSGDWDLALRRYEVRLNSPAVGGATSKNVLGFAFDNNKTATDAQVLALTTASTLAAFDSVRVGAIPAEASFQTDRLTTNPQGYLNLSGVPSANTANYWKVRTANGGFAVLRATRIKFTPSFAVDTLYLESRLQTGNALGAVQTLAIAPAGQTVSVSLVTNGVLAATGCNWDVQFNPAANALSLTPNTACNVGTYPGPSSPTFANATTANDAPQYGAFLSQLVGPIPNSVLDKSAPFRYNLQGNDRLHPAFNTYLVKSASRVYKFQVIDYYSNTGVPGFPTIRYARIQ
jgi:hypothetical protein